MAAVGLGREVGVADRKANPTASPGLRWSPDRPAKVELRDFNLTSRGPDDRGKTTAG